MEEAPLPDYGGDGVDYSYLFATNEIFDGFENTANWAKQVAIGSGFILISSSYKTTQKDGRKYRYLKCDRGRRENNCRDPETAKRPDTKSKACGCRFMIKCEQQQVEENNWVIELLHDRGTHNHTLIVYPEGHRGVSGLSQGAKEVVREMNDAQAKPKNIMVAIKNKFPDEHPNMRNIYNFKEKMRREGSEGRNVAEQMLHLAREHDYINWVSCSDRTSKVINRAFLAHPAMVEVLRTYPLVIGLDSTYKTNRYGFPFLEIVGVTPTNQNFLIAYAFMKDETAASYRWVLQKLKLLLGEDVIPSAIFTDKEGGLMRPVAEVFPNSRHLLCTWHINNDVEARVSFLCNKNKDVGRAFKNGVWKRIMEASTVEEYDRAVASMEDCYVRWQSVIDYVHNTWLTDHRQKFVLAWTNEVLHFGNITTCRVESQHSVVKSWLGSSQGSLDTVFRKVHASIINQVTEIKNGLESSRRRHGALFKSYLYQHLVGRVSHHALELILEEHMRMRQLSTEVFERCGCAKFSTHGLPCACNIYMAVQGGVGLYLDLVHRFWRTLEIGDGADIPEFVEESAQVVELFRSLVDDVLARDIAVVRDISRIVHDELHPENAGFEEPEPNLTRRGRPRKQRNSTTRNLSFVEHVRNMGPRRSCDQGSSSKSTQQTRSSLGSYMSIDLIPPGFKEWLPQFMLQYIRGYCDVIPDGNCRFRCAAEFFLGDQERYGEIRSTLVGEIGKLEQYRHVYRPDSIANVSWHINWRGGRC
ncbi:protein FAR1-RELATED SEQUENCE 5-like [Spinacia oleracea]|uniref:Protein FAR1-RELATED SEQUENCE 5-like n=1 Tax=Spinacia oleracea TaxID=3562 RepID=A0ABM3QXV1_SPIOL|nr:protein FAR1-RELATED SEQUENCE 5-like [Spinacia oleracea]